MALLTILSHPAQDPVWAIGSEKVIFKDDCSILETFSLPTPDLIAGYPLHYFYDGTPAVYSQQVEFDQYGQLMFFIIDGDIYNRGGYLMAEYLQDTDCAFCYGAENGRQSPEFLVTPVSAINNCSLFYVVYSHFDDNNDEQIEYLIVDISRDNPLFSETRIVGSIVHEDISGSYTQFSGLNYTNNGEEYYAGIELASYSPTGSDPQGYSRKEIYEKDGNFQKILFVNYESGYDVFEVNISGIVPTSYGLDYGGGSSKIPIPGETEIQVHHTYTGLLTLACLKPLNSFHPSIRLHEMNFAGVLTPPNNEDVICSQNSPIEGLLEGPTGVNTYCRINGMEFDPTGRYLYITASEGTNYDTGVFVCYDLVAEEYILFNEVLGTNFFSNGDFNSQLELNYEYVQEIVDDELVITETIPCIYLKTANGISRIRHVSDPTGPDFSYEALPGSYSGAEYVSNNTAVRQLNKQNLNGVQLIPYFQDLCCIERNFVHALGDVDIQLNDDDYMAHWEQTDNPLWTTYMGLDEGSCVPIRVNGTITFHSGVDINLHGMVFEFGPEGRIVIEPGARVDLEAGTRLTNIECEENLWPGVIIKGTAGVDQSPEQGGDQGKMVMYSGSVIEHAALGVRVEAGGILKTLSSTFRNCFAGVMLEAYAYSNENNRSYFSNTTFLTDSLLYDGAEPFVHLILNKVQGVDIRQSSFLNTSDPDTEYDITQRGVGLHAVNSSFNIHGNNYTYDGVDEEGIDDDLHDAFYQLRIGMIVIDTSGNEESFTCDGMEFQECRSGIWVNGAKNEEIIFNNFELPANVIIPDEVNRIPEGIYLYGSTGYTVEENYFEGISKYQLARGILVDNSGAAENELYRNRFQDVNTGIQVENVNATLTFKQDGLESLCNYFDDCRTDTYLADASLWSPIQGDVSDIKDLTNNKFSANLCNSGFRDVVVHSGYGYVAGNTNLITFDYHHHEGTDITTPNCVSQHLDLDGQYVDDPWDYEDVCLNRWDDDGDGSGLIFGRTYKSDDTRSQAQLAQARDQEETYLADAKELYALNVDKNEKLDLLTAIQQTLTVTSSELKNLLYAKSPLSEDVIKASITRSQPMDSWHLTQVLVANTPLKKEVLIYLEESEVLSDYFMYHVYNAQENAGTGIKQLLEQEMSYRSHEIGRLEHLILQRSKHEQWRQDTLYTVSTDEVLALLANSDHPTALARRVSAAWSAGNTATATTLLADMPVDAQERDWLEYLLSKDADLDAWTENDQDELWYRYEQRQSGHDKALALLYALDPTLQEWPHPEMAPDVLPRLAYRPDWAQFEVDLLELAPNPVSDYVYITYPAEADGLAEISIYDGLGREVYRHRLGDKGLLELDCSAYSEGIYVVRLEASGLQIDTKKFTVVR